MFIAQTHLEDQILFQSHGFIVEICIRPESLRRACQLRYEAYHEKQLVNANAAHLLIDEFDEQANSTTMLVWYENEAVGTIRNSVFSKTYDWAAIPAWQYDPDFMTRNFSHTDSILESNRHAIRPGLSGRDSRLVRGMLFRVQALAQYVDPTDWIITLVQERHAKFYERFMGMKSHPDHFDISGHTEDVQIGPGRCLMRTSPGECSFPYSAVDFLELDERIAVGRYANLRMLLNRQMA
ncbi:MAG: hypothetical protein AAF206_14840 [Bacteroidota bacterium]